MKIFKIVLLPFIILSLVSCNNSNDISKQKFAKKLCKVDKKEKHIKIPVEYFTGDKSLICSFGKYSLSVMQDDINDPGHSLYLVTPPESAKKAYDCDGKADNGITKIAMNCLLVKDK